MVHPARPAATHAVPARDGLYAKRREKVLVEVTPGSDQGDQTNGESLEGAVEVGGKGEEKEGKMRKADEEKGGKVGGGAARHS